MATCAALILAGGSGSRLGSEIPKHYLPIGGRAIIWHAAQAFLRHPAVHRVRVVVRDQDREQCRAALAGLDLGDFVTGGATRQDSARLGLESLASFAPDHVMIHDAARPFPSGDLIQNAVAALADSPARCRRSPSATPSSGRRPGNLGLSRPLTAPGCGGRRRPRRFATPTFSPPTAPPRASNLPTTPRLPSGPDLRSPSCRAARKT